MGRTHLQRLGRRTLHVVTYTAGAFNLFLHTQRRLIALRSAPVRTVLLRQVYFSGIEPLATVTFIGALIGVVIITQVTNMVGPDASLTGRILVWTVVRELGPLVTAILVVARSCSAVASELGSMRVHNEVNSLVTMGIDPRDYLIVPRISGITAGIVVLTLYFQFAAIAGGLLLSSILFVDVQLAHHFAGILAQVSPLDLGVSLLKSVVFGTIVSTVSCYHGFRVHESMTEIPKVTAVAVIHSLLLVVTSDGVITLASFS